MRRATRPGRPAGPIGSEVWLELTAIPPPALTDPAALSFLTMTSRPRFRGKFKGGEGGTTGVCMARWPIEWSRSARWPLAWVTT